MGEQIGHDFEQICVMCCTVATMQNFVYLVILLFVGNNFRYFIVCYHFRCVLVYCISRLFVREFFCDKTKNMISMKFTAIENFDFMLCMHVHTCTCMCTYTSTVVSDEVLYTHVSV